MVLMSPLRQPIVHELEAKKHGLEVTWSQHVDPHLSAVRAKFVDPVVAKVQARKLFVQDKFAEAKADPVAFTKSNVPILCSALLSTARTVLGRAGNLFKSFKWPAVGVVFVHDRVMTRKYHEGVCVCVCVCVHAYISALYIYVCTHTLSLSHTHTHNTHREGVARCVGQSLWELVARERGGSWGGGRWGGGGGGCYRNFERRFRKERRTRQEKQAGGIERQLVPKSPL
jgi:hypothetical protein